MAGDVVERTLFRNDHLLVGEFWCPPESERWSEVNEVSPALHVVFPRTSVVIRQLGSEPVLTDRNHVLFYNPGQRFLRSLHDRGGDHCYFVEVERSALAQLVDHDEEVFPFGIGPCDPDAFLLQHEAVAHLCEPEPDPLIVEESLMEALARVCTRAWSFHRRRPTAERASTRATHRKAVETAKALLAERLGERLTLDEIAAGVSISKYHLARLFRAATGFSLHGYRNQLRLRVALERLSDDDVPLAALATELGFVSNSHLTGSFQRAFGVTPSAARGRARVAAARRARP
jgi:AraC-like DNA-binding protein